MKKVEKICVTLHFLVGVGALAGGSAAITDPQNPMGLNAAESLRFSPFGSFLIPGIILFSVIGLGNIFAALVFFRNWRQKPVISGFFASALIVWIIVQCIMMRTIVILHVVFFCIGSIQGLLALYQLIGSQKNKIKNVKKVD